MPSGVLFFLKAFDKESENQLHLVREKIKEYFGLTIV